MVNVENDDEGTAVDAVKSVSVSCELIGDNSDDDSTEIANIIVNDLIGLAVCARRNESEDLSLSSEDDSYLSLSFDEDDIEKRIKDLRRISENHLVCSSGQKSDKSFESFSEVEPAGFGYINNNNDVDLDDRHWKRIYKQKRSHPSPDISPVKKLFRSSTSLSSSSRPVNLIPEYFQQRSSPPLSASTPISPGPIPWTATEARPLLFWSDAREHRISREPFSSFIVTDDRPDQVELTHYDHPEVELSLHNYSEVELSHYDYPEVFDDQLDLREILKRRRTNQTIETGEMKSSSVVRIDAIKVTVDNEFGSRRVVETDHEEQESNIEDEDDLEEGEILDRTDRFKEVKPKNKNLMSDLLRKKKVLEQLIHIVNQEENEEKMIKGNIQNIISQSSDNECDIESEVFFTHDGQSTRTVVYRGSSPAPDLVPGDAGSSKTILNDFTAEMDKRMFNMFPSKPDLTEACIKVEALSEDDQVAVNDLWLTTSLSKEAIPELMTESVASSFLLSPHPRFCCPLCGVTVATQRSLRQHCQGKRHQHNIEKAKHVEDVAATNVDIVGIVGDKRVQETVVKHTSEIDETKYISRTTTKDINVIKKPTRKKIIWDLK